MDTTLTINFAERLTSHDYTREVAAPIRMEIESVWDCASSIILDFNYLEHASVSFFDELVGKLFTRFDKAGVMKKVQIIHLSDEDRILLGNIVNSRIRQRENSQVTP